MARLRTATGELQRRVESELDLVGACTCWLDYRLYLFRMYGFHAPIERALGITPGLESVVADAYLRNNKVALLSHDLVALGVERRDLAQLPRMPAPALHDLPDALGWMYVLESLTLDGKRLTRHLSIPLPLEMQSAAAYLGCYGDEVMKRWAHFGTAVDRFAASPAVIDRVVEAATDCLSRLGRWLRPAATRSDRFVRLSG